jgi:hypothetical protein
MKTCLAWKTSRGVYFGGQEAYYPHYHPLLFLSSGLIAFSADKFQLNFLDGAVPIWIYFDCTNTKEYLSPWICGMMELS